MVLQYTRRLLPHEHHRDSTGNVLHFCPAGRFSKAGSGAHCPSSAAHGPRYWVSVGQGGPRALGGPGATGYMSCRRGNLGFDSVGGRQHSEAYRGETEVSHMFAKAARTHSEHVHEDQRDANTAVAFGRDTAREHRISREDKQSVSSAEGG